MIRFDYDQRFLVIMRDFPLDIMVCITIVRTYDKMISFGVAGWLILRCHLLDLTVCLEKMTSLLVMKMLSFSFDGLSSVH